MKKILLVVVVLMVVSCNKETIHLPEPIKIEISVAELKTKYGIDLIEAEAQYYISNPTARRGGKKFTQEAIVVVWFFTLSFDGVTVSNLPSDWKFAGVQNLTLYVSVCNWYAGGVSIVTALSCPDATLNPGDKRGWCTDMGENVYISNVIN